MLRVLVLASGGGTNFQALLDAKARGEMPHTEFCGLISNNPGAAALDRARGAGIPAMVVSPKAYASREDFHRALEEAAAALSPDLLVLAGFLVAIPPGIIQRFGGRIINIHPSLIPAFCGKGYYGLKVHEAALARGVKWTGATVHFVNEGMDEGPIISQAVVPVREGDDAPTLQLRVMEEAEWRLLPKAVEDLASGRIPLPSLGA